MYTSRTTSMELRCARCNRAVNVCVQGNALQVDCPTCYTRLDELSGIVSSMTVLVKEYGEHAEDLD